MVVGGGGGGGGGVGVGVGVGGGGGGYFEMALFSYHLRAPYSYISLGVLQRFICHWCSGCLHFPHKTRG